MDSPLPCSKSFDLHLQAAIVLSILLQIECCLFQFSHGPVLFFGGSLQLYLKSSHLFLTLFESGLSLVELNVDPLKLVVVLLELTGGLVLLGLGLDAIGLALVESFSNHGKIEIGPFEIFLELGLSVLGSGQL